jgi:hypothetical protein
LVSTGVGGQNATGTAFYDLFGTTHSDTFEIHTYCFELFTFDPDIDSTESNDDSDVGGRFVGPNGIVINFNQNNPNLSWALQTPITGVSIAANGDLSTNNVPVGTQIVVVISYTDPDTNFVVSTTYTVAVVSGG